MNNEFKYGWYLNSKETQERLFDLGYKWFSGGKVFKYPDEKYITTYRDGQLVCGKGPCKIKGTQLDEVDNMKELITKEELKSALKTIRKLENCKYLIDLHISNGVLHYLEPDTLYGYEVAYKGNTSNTDNEDTDLNEFLSVVNQDYNKKKELEDSLKKLLSEVENIKKKIKEL